MWIKQVVTAEVCYYTENCERVNWISNIITAFLWAHKPVSGKYNKDTIDQYKYNSRTSRQYYEK